MKKLVLVGMACLTIAGCVRTTQMMVNPDTGQQILLEAYPAPTVGSVIHTMSIQKQRIKQLEKYGFQQVEPSK